MCWVTLFRRLFQPLVSRRFRGAPLIPFHTALYSLTYKGSVISDVSSAPVFWGGMMWGHGRLPLEFTMGDIENLLDKMQTLPKDPSPEQLTDFYSDAAQLVWLIGNTTPLGRGSGSVAELTLKAIFEFHGLQAPILKPEFPQLDVLDITFPLDDYIKLFPYFCEPSSLPKHLQKPTLPHLSAVEQIETYYNEINDATRIAPSPAETKEMTEISISTHAAPSPVVTLSTSAQGLRSGGKHPPPPPLPAEPQKKNPPSPT